MGEVKFERRRRRCGKENWEAGGCEVDGRGYRREEKYDAKIEKREDGHPYTRLRHTAPFGISSFPKTLIPHYFFRCVT